MIQGGIFEALISLTEPEIEGISPEKNKEKAKAQNKPYRKRKVFIFHKVFRDFFRLIFLALETHECLKWEGGLHSNFLKKINLATQKCLTRSYFSE